MDTNRVFIVDIVFVVKWDWGSAAFGVHPMRDPLPCLPLWMGRRRLDNGVLIKSSSSSFLRFQPFSAWN